MKIVTSIYIGVCDQKDSGREIARVAKARNATTLVKITISKTLRSLFHYTR